MSSIYTTSTDTTFDLNVSLQKRWQEPYLKAVQNWISQVQRLQTVEPVSSNSKLGLDTNVANTSTTNASAAEINTATTSYTSNTLSFSTGTSKATLKGAFDANYTSITLKFVGAQTISGTAAAVRFQVLDQLSNVIGDHSVSIATGDSVSLPEVGLTVSFSAGTTVNNETATTATSQTTKTDVDPTTVFNASDANLRPRFENNAQVTAGKFTVNDYDITVNANDTINAVLNRITTTVPNVKATFYADVVTLSTVDASNRVISLIGDTSGFLSAVKLSTGGSAIGTVADDRQVLNTTTEFAGVRKGSFLVNNVSIAVAPKVDTMQSVLTRINNSGAGVQASYDYATDKVTFTSTSGDPISLSGDKTGFLSAIKVTNDDAFAPPEDHRVESPRGKMGPEEYVALAYDERDRQLLLMWSATNAASSAAKTWDRPGTQHQADVLGLGWQGRATKTILTDWDQEPAGGWAQKLPDDWQSLYRLK